MEVTPKLTNLKYVIELTPDKAESILEYLEYDEGVTRQDDFIKALKDAGVRDISARMNNSQIKLPKYKIEI